MHMMVCAPARTTGWCLQHRPQAELCDCVPGVLTPNHLHRVAPAHSACIDRTAQVGIDAQGTLGKFELDIHLVRVIKTAAGIEYA